LEEKLILLPKTIYCPDPVLKEQFHVKSFQIQPLTLNISCSISDFRTVDNLYLNKMNSLTTFISSLQNLELKIDKFLVSGLLTEKTILSQLVQFYKQQAIKNVSGIVKNALKFPVLK
jgi:hypothetical protein